MEDQITVIEPNGVRRSRPITSASLTIGRGTDSDLVINYTSASRQHARVMFDGNDYYVVDLGSTNGTYLDDTRLAPNVPERWLSGQTLRIGDILFQLEHAGTAPQQVIPGESRSTSPDHLETRVGWTMENEAKHPGQKRQSASRLPLILAIVAIFLCLVALAIAGAYFFLQ